MARDYLHRRTRGRNLAPWQPVANNHLAVPDAPTPGQPVMAEPQRFRTTARVAYEASLSVLAIESLDFNITTATRRAITEFAPGKRRAPRSAYEIALSSPMQGEQIPPALGWSATEAYQHVARRAPHTEYGWLALYPFLTITDPAHPPIYPNRAPGPRRAAQTAYRAGGGVVDQIADGAPQAGCCYTPGRPDQATAQHTRPDTSSGYRASRPEQGNTQRSRPDTTSGYRPQRPDQGNTNRTRPGDC